MPGFIRTAMSIVNNVDETTSEQFNITYVVLFLAARRRTYFTGADLIVDGGLTITL